MNIDTSYNGQFWLNPKYQSNVFKAENQSVGDGISSAQRLHKQDQEYNQQMLAWATQS